MSHSIHEMHQVLIHRNMTPVWLLTHFHPLSSIIPSTRKMGLPVETADVLFEALSPTDFGGAFTGYHMALDLVSFLEVELGYRMMYTVYNYTIHNIQKVRVNMYYNYQ